jgi:hypothetical protein
LPWNEFLIPVLAGYAFIHFFHLTKFRAQRYDGYRLLIESTLVGVILFVLSRLTIIWLHGTRIGAQTELWIHREGISYPYLGSGVFALALAGASAQIANWIIGIDRAKDIVVKKHSNGFLRLFHDALLQSKLVSVTLNSKKVYIGFITRTPSLTPDEQFVDLLPLLSGYRDKDTMRLEITTNYAAVLSSETCNASDFVITFGLDAISTAGLFAVVPLAETNS